MGEMYAALAHLGLKISRAAADELLKKYDADGSGELDEAEFTAFCVDAQARAIERSRERSPPSLSPPAPLPPRNAPSSR